jgi:hypothetical protein
MYDLYHMTRNRFVGTNRRVGRKKLFHSRITFPLSTDMLAAIDARRGGVKRVEWIRRVVERELRRQTAKTPRRKRR